MFTLYEQQRQRDVLNDIDYFFNILLLIPSRGKIYLRLVIEICISVA
jgi:hypothetical protein